MIIDIDFESWILIFQIIAFLAHIGAFLKTTKQPLSNFESQKRWKYEQLLGFKFTYELIS